MKNRSLNSKNKLQQLGQGMTEYIIIVALVAIAGIAAYSMFGKTVQGTLADVGGELSGQATAGKTAGENAKKLETKAKEGEKGMGTYGDQTH